MLSHVANFVLLAADLLRRVVLLVEVALAEDLLPFDCLVVDLLDFDALLDLLRASLEPLLQTQVLGLDLVLEGLLRLLSLLLYLPHLLLVLLVQVQQPSVQLLYLLLLQLLVQEYLAPRHAIHHQCRLRHLCGADSTSALHVSKLRRLASALLIQCLKVHALDDLLRDAQLTRLLYQIAVMHHHGDRRARMLIDLPQ